MRSLTIGATTISEVSEAYTIAEIGHNHGGSLEAAEALVLAAAAAGASAVKFQKRDNRALFTQAMYDEDYTSGNSFGATYGQHREALELSRGEYERLLQVAASCGVDMFATAFDLPSVDFLASLGVSAIKIASGDLTNTPLLEYAAKTELALVVSTGGARMDDVQRACDLVLPVNDRLAILQCTATYPARPEDLNLAVIPTLRAEFPDVVVGFSGHDLGPEMSLVAYALGARVIEKHFTLDHEAKGSDHLFSMEPEEFARLTSGLRDAHSALGSPVKRPLPSEAAALRKMGKKLVAAEDLRAGHVLTQDDVVPKSPGDGLQPYHLPEVLGRRLRVPLMRDDDICLADLQSAGPSWSSGTSRGAAPRESRP